MHISALLKVARRHPAKNPQIESSGTAAKRRSEAERRSNNPTVPRGLHPHPVLPTSHLLNAEELRQALRIIGEHLGNRRQRIYIVALGGLVNCVLLGSRAATKDIDWFNHFLSNDQWDQLNAAIVPACNADPKIITRTFKDHALNSIDLATLERIVWEALTQKTTVFHHGGLYVYAAPWIYQIIAKMERLGALNPNDVPNSYDLRDAIAYLRAHLKRNSLNPRPAVSWKYLWRECNSYGILSKYKDRYEICLELAQQINNGFREKWGFYGIRDLPEPSFNARIAELPGDFP
ncbi:MAG: hypothetical protein M1821_003101 [Bathelium mastoideum]|nr:MAG: hypothetical protein M1821_003101 [Bathelium mastoideum]